MSYKTILVHVDGSSRAQRRIEAAARIALAENAYLVGAAVTEGGSNMEPHGANAALDKFEDTARQIGVTSYEKRLVEGDAADGISMQGLYCDLIVLGQSDAGAPSLAAKVDFPEYVVLNCACPVLIVPGDGPVGSIGDRILIAWNASMAAARAVRNAMPFLQKAKSIQLAVINPPGWSKVRGGQRGADAAGYLARHGIKADVIERTVEADTGHGLLSLAAELHSDLIVMGCVTHPRSRGILLGGATRTVLEFAAVPVLMSH